MHRGAPTLDSLAQPELPDAKGEEERPSVCFSECLPNDAVKVGSRTSVFDSHLLGRAAYGPL